MPRDEHGVQGSASIMVTPVYKVPVLIGLCPATLVQRDGNRTYVLIRGTTKG
jgi:hypothetical protein